MKKTVVQKLAAALLVSSLALPALAKDKVVIGEQNWTGAIAIQHILGEVIKSRLDGDVSYLAGDLPVLFAAAGKDDGTVDVLTDVWLPNQSAAWAKYVTGSKTGPALCMGSSRPGKTVMRAGNGHYWCYWSVRSWLSGAHWRAVRKISYWPSRLTDRYLRKRHSISTTLLTGLR